MKNTIPGANTWLLNPAGVLFGAHAQLDVLGGFYAGSAESVKFADGAEFSARLSGPSTFSSAPPLAFGLLGSAPVSVENTSLAVLPGQALVLAGGNVEVRGDLPFSSGLSAPAGGIGIFAAPTGAIRLRNASVSTSGGPGGRIEVSGGRLEQEDSRVVSVTTQAGATGAGVAVRMAESAQISGISSGIQAVAMAGKAGTVTVEAPEITLQSAYISSTGVQAGSGGDVSVSGGNIHLRDGGMILSNAISGDSNGDISLRAAGTLRFSGRNPEVVDAGGITLDHYPSTISSSTLGYAAGGDISIEANRIEMDDGVISADTFGTGPAGNLRVQAQEADLRGGAMISSGTFLAGTGGHVAVTVAGALNLSGWRDGVLVSPLGQRFGYTQTHIGSNSFGSGAAGDVQVIAGNLVIDNGGISAFATNLGDGGDITVQAGSARMINGGSIGSSNGALALGDAWYGVDNPGRAGSIYLSVAGTLALGGVSRVPGGVPFPSSISTDNAGQQPAGDIQISAGAVLLEANSGITASSTGTGDAGNIVINTASLEAQAGGSITTRSARSAGGHIRAGVSERLYLAGGQISTSVSGGTGAGGNIEISPPRFALLNRSRITAQADEGHGGNIRIAADYFLHTPDSLVSASSRLGIDGEVQVPKSFEIGSQLVPPFQGFLDQAEVSQTLCARRVARSHLVWRNPDGSPLSAEDWQD